MRLQGLRRRIAAGLAVASLAVACGDGFGCRGGKTQNASLPQARSPEVAALEAKLKARLGVSHTHAIGQIIGHQWSEDERKLALWSASTVVIADVLSDRELARFAPPRSENITSAGFSPDGNAVVVVSRAPDAVSSTLEFYGVGEAAPKRRVTGAVGCGWSHPCWQLSRDSTVLVWLEAGAPGPNPGLRLHIDNLAVKDQDVIFQLPGAPSGSAPDPDSRTESPEPHGLELAKSGEVMVVHGETQVHIIEPSLGRSWHYPVVSEAVLAASGETVAWASSDGFVVWRRGHDGVLTLADPRCAPRHWPQRVMAKLLFSEDERTVATSGSSGTCLWDAGTGRLRTVLHVEGGGGESEFPAEPRDWVHAGKGLIVAGAGGNTLWDVTSRRVVRSGFSEWSARGSVPLLLDVPNEYERPLKLSVVDSSGDGPIEVREVAQLENKECPLELSSGDPLLMGFEGVARVACDPDPWFVELRTGESRRVTLSEQARPSVSPRGRLTLATRHGLAFAEPSKPDSPRFVIREIGSSKRANLAFDGTKLWILQQLGLGRVRSASIDFGGPSVNVAVRMLTNPCNDRWTSFIAARFGLAHLTDDAPTLCELSTGRELGRLRPPKPGRILAINADATVALLGSKMSPGQFWFVAEDKTRDAELALRFPLFAGPQTVVGDVEGKVVTVDARTGAQSTGWDLSRTQEGPILAADVASDRVVIGGDRPTLRRLKDGQVVSLLPVSGLTAAAFGPNQLLVGGDDQRLWLWHLPSPDPVGELLVDGTGVLYIASDGRFETSSPIEEWQPSLSCAIGEQKLPFATCRENLYSPGLLMRALGRVSGG